MKEMYQGVDVDFWAQQQTASPPPQGGFQAYSGWAPLRLSLHWSNFIPAIPLDIRYKSFKRRLDAAIGRSRS